MPQATVIGNLVLDGKPVEIGAVVEIKEPAFSNLIRKGRIAAGDVSAKVIEDDEPEEIEPIKPTKKKK